MFKSSAQRGAFFAALKKKKAGLDNPAAGKPIVQEAPMKLENIGSPIKPLPPVMAPLEQIQGKIPKFAKLKKIMKIPKV